MRFTLLDRITSLESRQSITAVKNLSLAEEYLADHFPGFPVMPGVLMIESLVQAGSWLMRYSEDFAYSTILLKRARQAKFVNFVSPGKTLTVTAQVQEWNGSECTFKAVGTVDGAATVSAKITLERFNLAERGAGVAAADELQISKAKELFAVLWPDASQAQ